MTCWPCYCWIASYVTVCLIHFTFSFYFWIMSKWNDSCSRAPKFSPLQIVVTCYPVHFLFQRSLLMSTVEPAVAADLPSNPNQPRIHKMSTIQFKTKDTFHCPSTATASDSLTSANTACANRQLPTIFHTAAGCFAKFSIYSYRNLESKWSTHFLPPVCWNLLVDPHNL